MNQKMLDLAKDVLSRIDYLRLRQGYYLEGRLEATTAERRTVDAQTHLPDIEKNCKVCALGALFLSYIRIHDKVPLEDLYYSDTSHGISPGYDYLFDRLVEIANNEDEIHAIESAFELKDMKEDHGLYDEYYDEDLAEYAFDKDPEIHKAINFGKKYKDDVKERLKAIMQNIVDNNGVFKPTVPVKTGE